MRAYKRKEVRFGWPEIILSTMAKTILNLNYKFHYTFAPFLMEEFGLNLQQWGVIQSIPELMMVICSLGTFFLSKYPPNKVNCFFMFFMVIPNFLLPLAGWVFSGMSAFYWILANRVIFGIGFSVANITIFGVIASFTSDSLRGRAMGVLEFSWTTADYLAPAIGVLLKDAPIYIVYYVQAVAALVIAVMFYLRYPKRAKTDDSLIKSNIGVDTPLIGGLGKGSRKLSVAETLISRKVMGVCFWAVLATSFMLMFSFVGLWLKEDYGLNSAQVGFAYFFAFTIPETCGFLYMSFLSDYFGLLRSSYFMTISFFIVGLVFGTLSNSLKLAPALLLVAISIFSMEIMFVSSLAYSTTKAVSDNPSLMSTIVWTAFNSGKAIWVAIGPVIWKDVGKIIESHPGLLINRFGAVCILTSIIMLSGVVCMEVGQQSICRKRTARTLSTSLEMQEKL